MTPTQSSSKHIFFSFPSPLHFKYYFFRKLSTNFFLLVLKDHMSTSMAMELARPRHQSSNGGFCTGDTTCNHCGKAFPSMKSLFGHMKCHPERYWRGMNPPSAVVLPTMSRAVDIKNWQVTARRGRHACGGQIKVEEVDDDLLAAESLLMLSRGREEDNEDKDKYSVRYELSHMYQSENESEKKMICYSRRKKAVRRKRKLETLEPVNGSMVCWGGTSNKSFPTSPALDEHGDAHKKVKSNRGDDEEDGGKEAAAGRPVIDFDLNELPHVEDAGAVDLSFHDAWLA